MNKTLLLGGLAALGLSLAGGVAVAQQAPTPTAHPGPVSRADFVERRVARLTAADANRDGTVTVEERRAARQAHHAERVAARFDRLDGDKNGALSREEFSTRPQRGERPEGARSHRGGRHGGRHMGRGMRDGAKGDQGPVVIAEARARAETAFAAIDTNRDGVVTADERRAGMERMREQRHERREARRAARAVQASPSAPASE